jgi:tetratricopeptide (TPR) repeat protein
MDRRSAKTIIAACIIVVGFAAVIALTRWVETARPPLPVGYEDEDIGLQGSKLKGFALGAEGLLADWYWMNSLQYMGKKISAVGLSNLNLDDMRPLNPRLLYPYLNNAADLDPKFMAPYSYGATILPAIDSAHAIQLTEKGIAHNPDKWRLYQYLGYIYWREGNYDKASEVYGEGSRIPGSPGFMRMMEARMKTEGGSRDLARDMYRQIAAESQDDISRQSAELRLLQIDSLDERDVINPAMREFRDRHGRCIGSWRELLPLLAGKKSINGRELRIDTDDNIVDPSGVPYLIEPKQCKAWIDGSRSKVPAV